MIVLIECFIWIACSRDGSIRLWECASGATIRSIVSGLDTQINAISLVNESLFAGPVRQDAREVETEGKTLLAGCQNGQFMGFDLGSKEKVSAIFMS